MYSAWRKESLQIKIYWILTIQRWYADIFYNIFWIILLISNIIFLLFLGAFSDGSLNIPGIKNKPMGYNKDIPKLIIVSLIRWIWVFLYMAQKHDK